MHIVNSLSEFQKITLHQSYGNQIPKITVITKTLYDTVLEILVCDKFPQLCARLQFSMFVSGAVKELRGD